MVFINGPFGVGKTSVANVLVERIPGAMIYDPEKVGSFLRSRILTRLDEEGSHEWCLSHLDVGLVASRDPAFGVEIQTDNRTHADVADQILKKLTS
jgi:hypothetical protein